MLMDSAARGVSFHRDMPESLEPSATRELKFHSLMLIPYVYK